MMNKRKCIKVKRDMCVSWMLGEVSILAIIFPIHVHFQYLSVSDFPYLSLTEETNVLLLQI